MPLALLVSAQLFSSPLPDLPEIRREPQITYLDRVGNVIATRGGKVPAPVSLERLPPYVPAAVVAIEDRRFYEHGGFDPVGIARAVVADIAKGRSAQGASTITQQLARNLYLTQEQTFERKATELAYAIQLERRYSKKQILGLYLSRVYWAPGTYGIEAASRRFFGHPAAKLTLREAATLAGMLKNPGGYNPVEHPERSAERARLVLDAMVDTGAITTAQRARALAKPLKTVSRASTAAGNYFVDWIDGQARRQIGALREDMVVETTLDMTLEDRAASALAGAVERGAKLGVEQGALVALDGVGAVRAMVGGADYAAAPYNRATLARRQPGSAFKPFVYLTAMESGLTPDTPVVDEPVTIQGWSPRNFEPEFMGPITLSTALAHSVNTVAARLADQVGRERVVAVAQRLGVTSPIGTNPAMALGAYGMSPLELATAYDTFSNGGRRATPYGLVRITTGEGRVVWRATPAAAPQVIANPPLQEMNAMLRGVIARGTGTKAAIKGHDLAGKTGTTSDYRDAWFAGYTGGLTTVVWLGRDDAKPMKGVTGGSVPAETWRAFMVAAAPHAGTGPIPAGPAPTILSTHPMEPDAPAAPSAPPMAESPIRPIPPLPPSGDPVRDLLSSPRG